MSSSRNTEAALASGFAEDTMISSSEILAEIPVAPKPDPLGKWRKRVLREMKRQSEWQSWHPLQKRKMRHLMMRHMNPDRGFFMRQAEFAKELGVSREKVNIFLRQAVERGFLTEPRGSDGMKVGWRGANVYYVHPRILEPSQQPSQQPSHTPSQLEVAQWKRCKGSSALAEADRCREVLHEETHEAASTDVPAAEDQEQALDEGLRGYSAPEPGTPVLAESPVQAETTPPTSACDTCDNLEDDNRYVFIAASGTRHILCKRCRVELLPDCEHVCRDPKARW